MGRFSESFQQCASQLDNQTLELIGINNKIIPFTKKAMSYRKTSMCLHTAGR